MTIKATYRRILSLLCLLVLCRKKPKIRALNEGEATLNYIFFSECVSIQSGTNPHLWGSDPFAEKRRIENR